MPRPPSPPLDRRAALQRLAAHAVVWCSVLPRHAVARSRSAGAAPGHAPGHPAPRTGITAARVVTDARLRELGAADAVRAAFDEVRQIPQVVDGVRCHCGCADGAGHYSLLSCYEGEAMARDCTICQGQGRMAFRLTRAGHSLDEIRAAVDARYG